jgi:hypothetical protein
MVVETSAWLLSDKDIRDASGTMDVPPRWGRLIGGAVARAQLRKVAEKMYAPCHHAGVGWDKIRAYECHTCRYELRKEVGLE